MDASSPTKRCPSCGLIHHAGLWCRERRRREVRYRPQLCLACRQAHRQPLARGKVDWEQGAAYPSGRAPRWGWAGRALAGLATSLKGMRLFGWLRRPGSGPKPGAPAPGQASRSLKPQPGA